MADMGMFLITIGMLGLGIGLFFVAWGLEFELIWWLRWKLWWKFHAWPLVKKRLGL